jgi:hypothetical protein
MNTHRLSRLELFLVTVLAFGCGGSSSSDAVTGPLLEIVETPTAAVVSLDNPLHVRAGLRVTNPTAIEFLVHFTGLDPIENSAPKQIQLDLETEVAGIVTPSMISLTIVSEAWSEPPTAVGTYVIEEPAPNLLPAVQIWQNGQVVADLTQFTESFEASLRFDANLKAWVLIAELVSTADPSFGPAIVTGTHSTTLTVGAGQLSAGIRESEAKFDVQPVAPPQVAFETSTRPSGGGIFNESRVEFVGNPIGFDGPEDLELGLRTEINFTPIVITYHVQQESWTQHPKRQGTYVVEAEVIDGEASPVSLPAVQIRENGQLVADLTKSIRRFEALLQFQANRKAWVLSLITEFDGDDGGATDGLTLLTGAHLAELTIGVQEQLSAGIRESVATFDVQPVF